MLSSSISTEPRNVKQIINRQNLKRKKVIQNNPTPKDDIDKLISAQRDPNSLVRTVLITGDSYIAFIYTEKQLNDIEQFCCKDSDVSVLGIDTTFKLCNIWLTDT